MSANQGASMRWWQRKRERQTKEIARLLLALDRAAARQ
jgi:hypothetical protein